MRPPRGDHARLYGLLSGRLAPADLGEEVWRALLPSARAQSLLPILHERLRGAPGLSADVVDALGRARRAAAAAAMAARARTAAATGACAAAGVEAVVLKGWPLAAGAWGDDTLRPCEDCDLLVRPEDRSRASTALRAAGFAPVGHHAEIHAGPLGIVDLHVDLVSAERVPARAAAGLRTGLAWKRRRAATVGGLDLLLLDPDDEVVYLAAHAVLHHGLGRPLLLLDVDRCLDARTPDAAALAARAAALGGSRWLRLALEARRLALGGVAPEPLRALLEAAAPPRRMESALLRRILREGAHPADRYIFALTGMRTWSDRAAFFRQSLLPSPNTLREVSAARGPHRSVGALYLRHAATAVRGCGNLLSAAAISALTFCTGRSNQ